MTGKAFAKHGPKYTAKINQAEDEWSARAAAIERGEIKSMWDIFEERGYIKDVAGNRDDIRELMIEKRIGAYVGIDPTAPSLHIGHLLPLMPLFWMYMHGFRAVTLIGGATARIGDPTGRLQTREELGSGAVTMNMVKLHYQLKKVWENVDEQARRFGYVRTWAWRRGVLQNGHWWNKLPMVEVLNRLGKGMRLGPMLSRDTVKRKLNEGDGMSFAEFSYPLLQAWDWWHMYVAQGIQMQIGGSDQYGNIVTGIDAFKIIRASEPDPARKLPTGGLHDTVGFTVPLLTDSSGTKFGKSTGNAVWLDRFKTPPFELYGYFVRRPDADVEALLRLFTFLPMSDIAALMAQQAAEPARRLPHHALAFEVVALVHGRQHAEDARAQHQALYGKKGKTSAAGTDTASPADTADPASSTGPIGRQPVTLNNAPPVDLQLPESLIRGGRIARILYAAGLVNSTSEGNRLAIQKGAYVGAAPGQAAHVNKGMSLINVDFTPVHLWFPQDTDNFIIDGKYMVLRRGSHHVRVIEIVSDSDWKASGRTYPGEPFTGKTRLLRQQLQALKAEAGDAGDAGDGGAAAGTATEPGRSEAMAAADDGSNGKIEFPDEKTARIRELEKDIRQEEARQNARGKEE